MTFINHTNYSTLLKQSTNPRGSAPNGNVYFDIENDEIQLIWRHQQATVNFGAGPVPNPLVFEDGITMRGLYRFESKTRREDNVLAGQMRGVDGNKAYRFSGAYNFISGVTLSVSDVDDRAGIRDSGFGEYAENGALNRVYHGVKSLNPIQATTTSRWALVTDLSEATLQAAVWHSFVRRGGINEVVQVFGSTANGDTGAGDFDYTTRTLVIRPRSWGYTSGEANSAATGISEFAGFSAGYGAGETRNARNVFSLADVYGAAKIAPWTGMSLEKYAVPQTRGGFSQADGQFTWILHNTIGGTVDQVGAFLDALSLQDADIDVGAGTYNGLKGRVWYTRDSDGRMVTSAELHVDGLSTAQKQLIVQTDNASNAKTYPYFPEVQISVGAIAPTDPLAHYRVMYANGAGFQDFDTPDFVIVEDAIGNPVIGSVQTDAVANKINFPYDFDANTQAGLNSMEPKDMVVTVEGDGIAAYAIAYFTVTRTAVIPVTCAPGPDDNA